MFAVPANLGKFTALELPDEGLLTDVRENALVENVNADDALMQRVRGKVARVRFDFR